MGYVSKDIAVITEPKRVSLSASPNFVQFQSKPLTKTFLELNLTINALPVTPSLTTRTRLVMTLKDGTVKTFNGTTVLDDVGGTVFYVSPDRADTAENLRQALLNDPWIAANFNITIPFIWVGDSPTNGNTMNILGLGAGDNFEFTLAAPADVTNSAYTIAWVETDSLNDDTISGEAATAQIDLDVYVNPAVFLGEDDKPNTPAKIGTYLTTLSKTYVGEPLWFNLNVLFNRYAAYNAPSGSFGWFDPGTMTAYRFVAKVKAINSFTFYQSNALYVLNGFGRPSDAINDLENYVLQDGAVSLLTNKPATTYTRGQKEYLNFIASKPYGDNLQVMCRVYSTADDFLGTVEDLHPLPASLNLLNTCALDLDAVLDGYPAAGILRVSLAYGGEIISNDLIYQVRPECLHILNAFTFLNKLGGWDTFNFDAKTVEEVKPNLDTYEKTLTPDFRPGQSLETVYANKLENSLSIEGAPVSAEVAKWLKELAGARTVLDNAGNYVIIETFDIKPTQGTGTLHTPTIKYRLTEAHE